MRRPWRIPVLLAATALAVSGCAAPIDANDPLSGDGAAPGPAPTTEPLPAQPVHHEEPTAEIALCTVLPTDLVGDLVSARTLDASGEGSQCTWQLRIPAAHAPPTPDLAAAEADATLQGAFLDVGAFDAGRPPVHEVAAVEEVAGVGDEAFVVHVGEAAPSTLYVRDGQRTLSLWLSDGAMTPEATERSLARVASLLIDLV